MSTRGVLLTVALAAAAAGCESYGGTAGEPLRKPGSRVVEGTWVHEPSGMAFPEEVGAFRRERVSTFDAEGRDVGVGYNLLTPDRVVAVTVFVYPSPPCSALGGSGDAIRSMKETLARREFDRRKSEILDAHPGARFLGDERTRIVRGGREWTGWKGRFAYRGSFGGLPVDAESDLLLFPYVGDRWTVKYRITRPAAVDASAEVEAFLAGFEWTAGER